MSNTERVRKHRDAMRAKGFRLLQIWVPDTRSAAFAKEARRQSRLLAANPDPDFDADWDNIAEQAFEE